MFMLPVTSHQHFYEKVNPLCVMLEMFWCGPSRIDGPTEMNVSLSTGRLMDVRKTLSCCQAETLKGWAELSSRQNATTASCSYLLWFGGSSCHSLSSADPQICCFMAASQSPTLNTSVSTTHVCVAKAVSRRRCRCVCVCVCVWHCLLKESLWAELSSDQLFWSVHIHVNPPAAAASLRSRLFKSSQVWFIRHHKSQLASRGFTVQS